MTYPQHADKAPESALADYLEQARELLASRDEPQIGEDSAMSSQFEHLRWFELPPVCMTPA
jgi:hypothetical protein